MTFDITSLRAQGQILPRPRQHTECREECHKHEPEPHKHVDLLVEEVDRQHALHGVSVGLTQSSNLKVTQGYPGEPGSRLPALRPQQRCQYLHNTCN